MGEDDVGEKSRRDRPIAPGDPSGQEPGAESLVVEDLKARIAELDAIAWNLPVRPRPSTGRREHSDD